MHPHRAIVACLESFGISTSLRIELDDNVISLYDGKSYLGKLFLRSDSVKFGEYPVVKYRGQVINFSDPSLLDCLKEAVEIRKTRAVLVENAAKSRRCQSDA